MRRRLDLAVSLIAAPPVLFLDEPTTGLDPRSRTELWEVLRGLVREGTTLLLTTQYLEEADHLADDIIVIDKGRVIAAGTPTQLKDQAGAASVVVTLTHAADLARAEELVRRCSPEVHVDVTARRLTAQADGLGDMSRIGSRLREQRHRGRRPRTQAPEPRRRVPPPHRAQGRGRDRRDRRDGRGPVMTTMFTATRPPISPPSMLRASGTIVWRNLIHIKRMPEMLLDVTVQSVMFVLLFAYVFGGSIQPPGDVVVQGVPAARDHGADDDLLLRRRRDGPHQRPAEGHRRPAEVACRSHDRRCWSVAASPASSTPASASR